MSKKSNLKKQSLSQEMSAIDNNTTVIAEEDEEKEEDSKTFQPNFIVVEKSDELGQTSTEEMAVTASVKKDH